MAFISDAEKMKALEGKVMVIRKDIPVCSPRSGWLKRNSVVRVGKINGEESFFVTDCETNSVCSVGVVYINRMIASEFLTKNIAVLSKEKLGQYALEVILVEESLWYSEFGFGNKERKLRKIENKIFGDIVKTKNKGV